MENDASPHLGQSNNAAFEQNKMPTSLIKGKNQAGSLGSKPKQGNVVAVSKQT